MARAIERHPDPACAQNATELTVRKQRDIAIEQAEASNQPICAGQYLRGHFTIGTTVPKNIPVWTILPDLDRLPAFIIAVVPLREISLYFRDSIQADEFASEMRALERTGQHTVEGDAPQVWPEFPRLGFAIGGERNVSMTGVPHGERPLSLAVSNEV